MAEALIGMWVLALAAGIVWALPLREDEHGLMGGLGPFLRVLIVGALLALPIMLVLLLT